jgi:hypothetical protein
MCANADGGCVPSSEVFATWNIEIHALSKQSAQCAQTLPDSKISWTGCANRTG